MPQSLHLSVGSNQTVKTGPGFLYGAIVGGANGGAVAFVDSVSIGATPNMVTQVSNGSNLGYLYALGTAPIAVPFYGSPFVEGLTVAATSNAPVTVFYD